MEKEYIALDVCDTDSDSRMPKSNAVTQHATQTASHIPSCEPTFFLRDLALWKVWRPITLGLKCLGLMWRNPEKDSPTGRPDLHTSVGNVQALGANQIAAFSPKAHG